MCRFLWEGADEVSGFINLQDIRQFISTQKVCIRGSFLLHFRSCAVKCSFPKLYHPTGLLPNISFEWSIQQGNSVLCKSYAPIIVKITPLPLGRWSIEKPKRSLIHCYKLYCVHPEFSCYNWIDNLSVLGDLDTKIIKIQWGHKNESLIQED